MSTDVAATHMGGFASGYDITSIVSNLVKAKAVTEDAWVTEDSTLQQSISDWSNISAAATDLTSSLDTLRGFDLWNARTATPSDTSKFTATATAAANSTSYAISISALAQAQTLASNHMPPSLGAPQFTGTAGDLNTDAVISVLGDGSGVTSASWSATYDGAKWTVVNTSSGATVGTITGATGSINLQNGSGAGFHLAINAPSGGSYNAGDTFVWTDTTRMATTDLVATNVLTAGSTFQIEGQTITVGSSETLNSLMGKINSASSSMPSANHVTASILDNRLVLTRNQTGSATINLADVSDTTLQKLGILDAANQMVQAQDATFSVNGTTVVRSTNTGISDVINGITLNLLAPTSTTDSTGATTDTPCTLTVAPNTAGVETAINTFITSYNTLAQGLDSYGSISLNSTGDAKGTSVDQTGDLYNDSLLQSLRTDMRSMATAAEQFETLYNAYKGSSSPSKTVINPSYTYNSTTGACQSLSDIGVWTSDTQTADTLSTNQLSVTDQTKLDYMLQNNFAQVQQLFVGVYDSTKGSYSGGIAQDFYNYANNASQTVTGSIAVHVQTLTNQDKALKTQISNYDTYLQGYEQDLWNQFTAMDDAIANCQSNLAALGSLSTGTTTAIGGGKTATTTSSSSSSS